MPAQPFIHIDVSALKRLVPALRDLSLSQQERVIPRALNDVMDGAYTRIVRSVAKETGAQQKRVRTVLAKKPAHASHPEAEIIARDRWMSLKDFSPTQRKAGVSADPWHKRRTFPGTFIGPGGQVFRRRTGKRLPIEILWGPSIPKQLITGGADRIVHEVAQERFARRLEYYTDRELGRVKAKYKV